MQTILILVTKLQDGLLDNQRSTVDMAKDLSHLHSCDTDIYKLETYFVAKKHKISFPRPFVVHRKTGIMMLSGLVNYITNKHLL